MQKKSEKQSNTLNDHITDARITCPACQEIMALKFEKRHKLGCYESDEKEYFEGHNGGIAQCKSIIDKHAKKEE